MEKDLEEFYNERIKTKQSPEFSELTESQKCDLENTLVFQGFRVGKAWGEFLKIAFGGLSKRIGTDQ